MLKAISDTIMVRYKNGVNYFSTQNAVGSLTIRSSGYVLEVKNLIYLHCLESEKSLYGEGYDLHQILLLPGSQGASETDGLVHTESDRIWWNIT